MCLKQLHTVSSYVWFGHAWSAKDVLLQLQYAYQGGKVCALVCQGWRWGETTRTVC
jgi:hypothetical protein